VIGLCCHRRRRNYFRQLDASVETSGPHDFIVRNTRASSSALSRPLHLVPNVRDDRERPSWWDETAALMKRFASGENGNIFAKLTGQPDTSDLAVRQNQRDQSQAALEAMIASDDLESCRPREGEDP